MHNRKNKTETSSLHHLKNKLKMILGVRWNKYWSLLAPHPSPSLASAKVSWQGGKTHKKKHIVDEFLLFFMKNKKTDNSSINHFKTNSSHKKKKRKGSGRRRPASVVVVVRLLRNPQKANNIRKFHKEFVCGSGDRQIKSEIVARVVKKCTFLRWKLPVYRVPITRDI